MQGTYLLPRNVVFTTLLWAAARIFLTEFNVGLKKNHNLLKTFQIKKKTFKFRKHDCFRCAASIISPNMLFSF